MLKIGRYRIAFGSTCWVQTYVPTTVRRFLCFWVFKEARPQDIDKERKFPVGTLLEQEGRTYRYWKASNSYQKGEAIKEDK